MLGVLAPSRSSRLRSCGSITASITPRAVPGYHSVPQNPAMELHHGCGRTMPLLVAGLGYGARTSHLNHSGEWVLKVLKHGSEIE